MGTNATRLAGSDIVGQTWDVTRVAHEDGCSNFGLSSCRNGNRRIADAFITVTSTAVRIVKKLTALSRSCQQAYTKGINKDLQSTCE